MDEDAIGLIAGLVVATVGLVVLLGAAGGIMYANDTAITATVIDKDCARGEVTVRTKAPVPGVEHTVQDVPLDKCSILRPGEDGNHVEYRIRSERTTFFEREGGTCIWDSSTGVTCGGSMMGL